MLYKLADWEQNGYHDSYFYGLLWDDEKKEMVEISLGATAYCSPPPETWVNAALPTKEVAETVRQWLERDIFLRLKNEYKRAYHFPTNVDTGDVVALIKPHRQQLKVQEDCRKCDGSGFWLNPRNDEDRRQCYTCCGTGKFNTKERRKDANGKCLTKKWSVGEMFEVIDCQAYGTFYRNGYNQPGRDNRSVVCRKGSEIVRFPLEKLCLAKPVPNSWKLRKRAFEISKGMEFQYHTKERCAGLSHNYTTGLLNS